MPPTANTTLGRRDVATLLVLSLNELGPVANHLVREWRRVLLLRAPQLRRALPADVDGFDLRVLGMLLGIVNNYRSRDQLAPALHELGRTHHGLGVGVAHYRAAAEVALEVLRRFHVAWTSELEAAWVDLLGFVHDRLVTGGAAAPTPPQ